ncbi:MAG: T9SS type A sorting domain-containing protein [Flavobacteriales bacterium]|nr:T9SS type A sorting domain-containing protein [Flavobacteriales bacterium]MEB2340457.1 T9SS type A sorting domain-containing protein [Flavobacteriia bacterium]
MKQRYSIVLFSAAILASAGARAQEVPLTLTNAEGEVVNGTTIELSEGVTGMLQLMGMGLRAVNTSGTDRLMNVKRYELDVLHGTMNYFCWDLCYGERYAGVSPLWVGADPIPMQAGDTANGFHAYYKPMNIVGTSAFRYVWYDMGNPDDSTYVDFIFNVTVGTGVAEVNDMAGFSVYPNPALGGTITFDYDLRGNAAGTRLAIYNMLGGRQLVKPLAAAQGRVRLGEGELGSGVWFAVLERDGKPLATKRLVVAR